MPFETKNAWTVYVEHVNNLMDILASVCQDGDPWGSAVRDAVAEYQENADSNVY